jgi:hypothetical protein
MKKKEFLFALGGILCRVLIHLIYFEDFIIVKMSAAQIKYFACDKATGFRIISLKGDALCSFSV